MRTALDVKPYNFLESFDQLRPVVNNISLLLDHESIIGSVSISDGEIDDLIVNESYQGKGYGKQLLDYAVSHLQKANITPIKLTVTQWNQKAISLYQKSGFVITETKEIVR